ncbi:HP1 family phage holin [Symbiopectobacterium purcellii]|uniref:HP1 family phage holin n=1 Tax=Symbiopectobacterium purcellii TaxID=2871826 RepID=UPI003F856738
MEKFITPSAYSSSLSTAVFGALTLNDWAFIFGIVFSVATFAINWYYRYREYRFRTRTPQ